MKEKNIFTHKFLPILGLVFFILFILFISDSFAYISSFDITLSSGTTVIVPPLRDITENDNYIICIRGSTLYYVAKLNSVPYDGKIYRSDNGKNSLYSVNYYYYSEPGVKGTYDIHYNEKDNSIITASTNRLNITSYDIWYTMSLIYSNKYDVYNENGSLYFSVNKVYDYEISLSTTEKTSNPITAYSNYFNSEDALNYKCYISEDGENFRSMNIETTTTDNITKVRYYYNILENGTYVFKFLNKETGEEKYITKTITNIIFDNTSSSTGIPIPHITYTRENNNFVLKTQSFDKSGVQRYIGYYVKVTDIIDYSNIIWNSMDLKLSYNSALDKYEYYYSINVPVESENTTYLFVFYDNSQNLYGNYNSFTTDIDFMIEYTDKTSYVTSSADLSSSDSRFTQLVNLFKQRFGFLTYPFEFIADLLNRILNIEYGEPIIHIPELKIPNTNNIIFNGYDYNFNTLLENQVINNIYNIYLIAVDFILVISLVILSKNILMEVLGNG